MRIVAGTWKGRLIEAPLGRAATRPTTDRIRESMASMIEASFGLDLAGVNILDAYAGTGAIGLELVSRGAAHAVLVDQDKDAIWHIKKTLAALQNPPQIYTMHTKAERMAAQAALIPAEFVPFDLVILDPPYRISATEVEKLITLLEADKLLSPRARLLYEHGNQTRALSLATYSCVKQKSHGICAFELYEQV